MPDNAIASRSTAPAPRANTEIGLLQSQLESRAQEIQMALPSHISLDKFQRVILTAVAQNPDLLKADRQSLILASYKAAQDGLLPDGTEAAFVVYNTRKKIDGQWKTVKLVQYTPMVKGLRKKVLQSGEVTDIFPAVVYRQEIAAGHFIYEEGTERMLRHKPILDPDFNPSDDDIALAYSVATFKDGSKSFEVMFRRDINKVRQCSQTGAIGRIAQYDMGEIKKGQEIPPKGPWVDWFSEQCKKSAIRRHTKTLPMSSDVFVDIEGREQLEYGSSAALALGSQTPDSPLAIEDQGATSDEPRHDPVTGEILDDDHNDVSADNGSHERVTETAKAEPEAKPELEAKPAGARRGRQADQAEQSTGEQEPAAEAQPERATTGEGGEPAGEFTQDPFEAKGDEYLGRFEKAENVIDLDGAKKEFDAESEGWPYEVVQGVEAGYRRHQRRLAPARQPQPEPAE